VSQWAVVLGVSAGTGRAIARAVAEQHDLDVFGVHRGHHPEDAALLAHEIRSLGRRAEFRIDDAGTAAHAQVGADQVLAAAGPRSIKLFVHSIANASLGRFTVGEDRLVPKQFAKTFDSMAHSFVYWAQAMLDRDLLAPGARLLALTNPLHESILSHCGLVAASKAALEMYVRYLALELGPLGLRVNMLKFATVVTPAVARVYGESELARIEAVHRSIIPAGRMCTTDEVGGFVSLLLDPRAEWVNGATIDFTGGMTQSLLDVVLMRRAGELSGSL
jgi:NAD(P)-dependent dehydrogenase (short-subunit alcohol dehydrogenase family)